VKTVKNPSFRLFFCHISYPLRSIIQNSLFYPLEVQLLLPNAANQPRGFLRRLN